VNKLKDFFNGATFHYIVMGTLIFNAVTCLFSPTRLDVLGWIIAIILTLDRKPE